MARGRLVALLKVRKKPGPLSASTPQPLDAELAGGSVRSRAIERIVKRLVVLALGVVGKLRRSFRLLAGREGAHEGASPSNTRRSLPPDLIRECEAAIRPVLGRTHSVFGLSFPNCRDCGNGNGQEFDERYRPCKVGPGLQVQGVMMLLGVMKIVKRLVGWRVVPVPEIIKHSSVSSR